MPMSVSSTPGGSAYVDIRVGDSHNIHQILLDVSGLTAADDADGYLPPGLPLLATGLPVSGAGQTAVAVLGPEAVKIGTDDIFGNCFLDGALNQDAIEDNLGRVLSANEIAALGLGGFTLV
jgi:hypothetical protein